MLSYTPPVAHWYVPTETSLPEFSTFHIRCRARAHTVPNCVAISFKSIRSDGLGLLFIGLQHKRGATPYYVVVQMQSSEVRLEASCMLDACVCLHQVFAMTHAIHRAHISRSIYMHMS